MYAEFLLSNRKKFGEAEMCKKFIPIALTLLPPFFEAHCFCVYFFGCKVLLPTKPAAIRAARWFVFKTKIPIFEKFSGPQIG
jgi:hypothetical protein